MLVCLCGTAGTNRALLCKSSSDGQNQVLQIGRPHSTDNEEELQRMAALGETDGRGNIILIGFIWHNF